MSDRPREDVIRANPNLPLFALPPDEAAAALGMSVKSFTRHVRPHVRLIRRGALLLVPVGELQRWSEENAEHTIERTAA